TFYKKYYCPNNAVLVIAGRTSVDEVRPLVEKWFGDLPAAAPIERTLPPEPPQKTLQQRLLHGTAPADALYLAFHIPSRVDADFYAVDLISDILGNGPSSRLYQRLLKGKQCLSYVDCYISGTIDPGLLIIEAKPAEGVSVAAARQAIWYELEALKSGGIRTRELEKVQNKVESNLILSESNILNKAINLAFFEILGNADLINQEPQLYRKVMATQIQQLAQHILVEENCSEVCYTAAS
ncbi:MAG: insulinase family protein, partial [Bacteroidota bacterium]